MKKFLLLPINVKKGPTVSRIHRYIRTTLAVLGIIILVLMIVLNAPWVQRGTSRLLVSTIEEKTGAEVGISSLRWRFPSDIVVDSLHIHDQQGAPLFTADRMALKVKWMPLLRDKLFDIRNVRLYTPVVTLTADTLGGPLNAQFLMDAFATDTTDEGGLLNLRINSFIIRHAAFRYDVASEPQTPSRFNPSHVSVDDFNAHVSLKALSPDSLHLVFRQLHFTEQSGFVLDDLQFRLKANHLGTTLTDFAFDMPHTEIRLDTLCVGYLLPTFDEARKDTSLLTPANFTSLLRTVTYRGVLGNSQFTPSDLEAFIPALRFIDDRLTMSAVFKGDVRWIDVDQLSLRTPRRDIDIQLNGYADLHDKKRPLMAGDLQQLSVTEAGWRLAHGLTTTLDGLTGTSLSPMVQTVAERLGAASLNGAFELSPRLAKADLVFHAEVGQGTLKANMDEQGRFDALVDGQSLNLGRMLARSDLGTTAATLSSTGLFQMESHTLRQAEVAASFDSLQYLGYSYHPIHLSGTLENNKVTASIAVDDPNLHTHINGHYSWTAAGRKSLRFNADVDSLDIHALHLSPTHEATRFAFLASANLSGSSLDELSGSLSLQDFSLTDSSHVWTLDRFSLSAVPEADRQTYSVISDFMNGALTGDFRFSTLKGTVYNLLSRYEPTLASVLMPHSATAAKMASRRVAAGKSNELSFNLSITDLLPVEELLGLPVVLRNPAVISGYLFEKSGQVSLKANVPQLLVADSRYRDLSFQLGNLRDTLSATMGASLLADDGSQLHIHVGALGKNDGSGVTLSWNETGSKPMSGEVSADVAFSRNPANRLLTSISVHPAEALLGSTTWRFDPFQAYLTPDKYTLDGLHISSGNQYLAADGSMATREGLRSDEPDSLSVRLGDLDLGYVLDFVPLTPTLRFGGHATGSASLSRLLSGSPRVNALLGIRDLSFCGGPLGDATALVGYNDEGILFDVQANELSSSRDSVPHTRVSGTASIAASTLDLTVDARGTRISFLNGLIGSIMTDVDGRAYGSLRIHGPLDALDMEGDIHAATASLRLPTTNVAYRFDDIVRFRPGTIRFDNYTVYDRYGHSALLQGSVHHSHLKDWAYDIVVDAHEILGIEYPNTGNDLFYATLFADGTVHVHGSDYVPLTVDIDARTCKNSLFALNLSASSESDAGFITYRDRDQLAKLEEERRQRLSAANASRRQRTPRPGSRRQRRQTGELVGSEYDINIHANITPDAAIKLVMDQTTDDNVSAYGSGALDIRIHNGTLSMYGPFVISYGFYRLNVQDLLHKDFEIIHGSSVTFDGDPMDARLNITAQYMAGSVSLADLTPDAASMDNVRVNCLLGIKGTPNSPQLKFDLELPQGTEEQKTVLRSYTATEEQMNLQFVYLLGLGKFYTYDYGQMTGGTQGGFSAMTSLVNTTLSGQINSIISGMLPNNNWSLSGNIRSDNILGNYADEDLTGNMEVQGVLEGRLLNNRLLVNGNFGYRDNPMYASNFIGDFDIRYLLTPRYDLWVKGYNKTNDRYFSKTALTTQGIGLMFNKDFDSLFKRKSKAILISPVDTIPAGQ